MQVRAVSDGRYQAKMRKGMSTMKEKSANPPKHSGLRNLRNGVFWSSRYISGAVTNTLFVSYLSFYATNVLGMPLELIAAVLLITKLFDGVTAGDRRPGMERCRELEGSA